MKRIVFLLCIALLSGEDLVAQKNYTIRYAVYNYSDSLFTNKINNLLRNDVLFINGDSVSFYWHQGPIRKYGKPTVGGKGIHHSIYTFPLLYKILDVSAWTKPYALHESDTKIFNWTILKDTKIIEGYSCTLAVSEKTRAWFTKEIPISSGPSIYNDLPGVILRLEDYKYERTFQAVSVKKNSPKIVLPDIPIEECKHCETKVGEIKNYFLH